MNYLYYFPILVATSWVTWIFFLAVMHLRIIRNGEGFTKWNIIPAYAVLVVGLLFDASLNLLMCVILLNLPREALLTYKLKRLLQTDSGWRHTAAEWMCRQFLMPADKTHCG